MRIAYWVGITRTWTPQSDADQYLLIARSLADGDGYGLLLPAAAPPPDGLPAPAATRWSSRPAPGSFGDAIWPARLVTLLIGSAVAVLAAVLATRIAGRRAGIVAGLIVAVYPPLLANDTITLTEPLALLLLLAAVLLADDDRWVWAGVALGGSLLTRPNGYGLVAVIAVWVAWRLGWKRGLGVAAVALLCLVPWLVRNRIQVDTWKPYTSDGFTTAAVYSDPARRAGHFIDPVFNQEFRGLGPSPRPVRRERVERSARRDALHGIRTDPDYVWYMVRRNFRGYFEINPSLNTYSESEDGRNFDFRRPMLPVVYVVTVLGIAGLVRFRRDQRSIVLFAIGFQFAVVSLLLVAPPRLRAPVDLICCIGVGLLCAPRRASVDEPAEPPSSNRSRRPSRRRDRRGLAAGDSAGREWLAYRVRPWSGPLGSRTSDTSATSATRSSTTSTTPTTMPRSSTS